MNAEEKLIQKIANRIDNDNGYDNLSMAKDIAKIAREYHAKEMERKLERIKQRVSKEDALRILEKLISNHTDKLYSSVEYVEDYAGGSQRFINEDIINSLIKKITR